MSLRHSKDSSLTKQLIIQILKPVQLIQVFRKAIIEFKYVSKYKFTMKSEWRGQLSPSKFPSNTDQGWDIEKFVISQLKYNLNTYEHT